MTPGTQEDLHEDDRETVRQAAHDAIQAALGAVT